jgi:hypothetical protein
VQKLKAEALNIAPGWYASKDKAEVEAGERSLERQQDVKKVVEAGSGESFTKSPTILQNERNRERLLLFIEYKEQLEALEQ